MVVALESGSSSLRTTSYNLYAIPDLVPLCCAFLFWVTVVIFMGAYMVLFKWLKRQMISSLLSGANFLISFQDGRRQEADPPQVSACVWWSFGSVRTRKKGTRIRTVVVTGLKKSYARHLLGFWFCSRVGVRIPLLYRHSCVLSLSRR